jgi:hypothetical protein
MGGDRRTQLLPEFPKGWCTTEKIFLEAGAPTEAHHFLKGFTHALYDIYSNYLVSKPNQRCLNLPEARYMIQNSVKNIKPLMERFRLAKIVSLASVQRAALAARFF